MFEHTKVKVLAPSIAKKFLQINYSCIGVNFLETISDLSFNNEDEKCDIYAWPYLDETFTCVTSYNLVQEIIQNFHFVFNFKEDTSGRMFANLLGNFVNNPADSALFAASSFNISMFIRPEDVRSSMSLHDALSVYAFSEHHFEWMEATDYGLFRKMFIAYVSSVRAFKREFIRDLEKEKGIYPC